MPSPESLSFSSSSLPVTTVAPPSASDCVTPAYGEELPPSTSTVTSASDAMRSASAKPSVFFDLMPHPFAYATREANTLMPSNTVTTSARRCGAV